MDKQKQIEEMAKDMLEYGMEKYPTGESVFTETKLRDSFYHVFLTYAEHLYNAGYRKIPENAVVLTREELEKYTGCEISTLVTRIVHLERQLGKARKETAEKFAEKAKAVLVKAYDYYVKLAERNRKAGNEEWYHRWEGEATATQKSIDLMDEICKGFVEGKA